MKSYYLVNTILIFFLFKIILIPFVLQYLHNFFIFVSPDFLRLWHHMAIIFIHSVTLLPFGLITAFSILKFTMSTRKLLRIIKIDLLCATHYHVSSVSNVLKRNDLAVGKSESAVFKRDWEHIFKIGAVTRAGCEGIEFGGAEHRSGKNKDAATLFMH